MATVKQVAMIPHYLKKYIFSKTVFLVLSIPVDLLVFLSEYSLVGDVKRCVIEWMSTQNQGTPVTSLLWNSAWSSVSADLVLLIL